MARDVKSVAMTGSSLIDMTGRKVGPFTVLVQSRNTLNGKNARWLCSCECGTLMIARGTALRNMKLRPCDSCGRAA